MRWECRGASCVAFALGMVAASLFPYRAAVFIIAAILVLAGLSLCRF